VLCRQQTACMASRGAGSGGSGTGEGAAAAPADLAAWDAARLAADAQAMAAMAAKSESESSMEEAAPEAAPPGAWKWAIRKQIWDMMEEQDLADFPRPGRWKRCTQVGRLHFPLPCLLPDQSCLVPASLMLPALFCPNLQCCTQLSGPLPLCSAPPHPQLQGRRRGGSHLGRPARVCGGAVHQSQPRHTPESRCGEPVAWKGLS